MSARSTLTGVGGQKECTPKAVKSDAFKADLIPVPAVIPTAKATSSHPHPREGSHRKRTLFLIVLDLIKCWKARLPTCPGDHTCSFPSSLGIEFRLRLGCGFCPTLPDSSELTI